MLRAPLRVIHGDADPTVPPGDAFDLARAARVTPVLVPGANHVFDTPNPWQGDLGPALVTVLDDVERFVVANI